MKLRWGMGAGALIVLATLGYRLSYSDENRSGFAAGRTSPFSGSYTSGCTPLKIGGDSLYSVFRIAFDTEFTAEETAYQDSECTISVFKTSSRGSFKTPTAGLLSLELKNARFTTLSSQMAESMNANQSCGLSWIYGEEADILGTDCIASDANYFFTPSENGMSFYDCGEGQTSPDNSCTHYMTRHSES